MRQIGSFKIWNSTQSGFECNRAIGSIKQIWPIGICDIRVVCAHQYTSVHISTHQNQHTPNAPRHTQSIHEAIPNQNRLEAVRLSQKTLPKAINRTPNGLGSSTRQARPRMKGLQPEADGATACKNTWRSLKHRNGEQHLCIFCCLIQITSPTTYCRSQVFGVCATGCQEIALSA